MKSILLLRWIVRLAMPNDVIRVLDPILGTLYCKVDLTGHEYHNRQNNLRVARSPTFLYLEFGGI